MLRLVALIGQTFLPLAAATAQMPSETEQKKNWLQAQASQRTFERQQFERAGFPSIAELELEGRDVRRLLLRDPYGMLAVPGIELERISDGRVTLRFLYDGWSSDPTVVAQSAWDRLVSQEPAVYSVPVFQPRSTSIKPPQGPPPICHGWIARLQADYLRTASWAACGRSASGPRFDYIVAIIEIAVATKPQCAFADQDPFRSFSKCFAASQELDDPELEQLFAILRHEHASAPVSERLAEARKALSASQMSMGNQAWLDAQIAVARYKEAQDRRREQLLSLRQLASSANYASKADKAKMQQTIREWSDSLNAQQANYVRLLESLVWLTDSAKAD